MYEESGLGRPPRPGPTATWPVSFRLDYLAKMYLEVLARNSKMTKTEVLESLIFRAFRDFNFKTPYADKASSKGVYVKRSRKKILIEIVVPDSGIS